MDNRFRAARKASDMTYDQAATCCDVSKPTYVQHEQYPQDYRLSELRGLYSGMTETARPILMDAVRLFICSDYSV